MDFLATHENTVRLAVFAGVLLLMALLEALFPRRARVQSRVRRWASNLGLIAIDTLALRLVLPIVAVGMAAFTAERGWGLLNLVAWPAWLEIVLAVVVLDMLIYWQHVATHHIPWLWRLHKIHHADRDFDVTTGIRFHPVEIILSMLYKFVCIIVLGPAVAAVILFEVLLNGCAMFNHANVRLPAWFDRCLRLVIVTPDMHRVHHSVVPTETNSNYGFSLSWWDRLFGTYIPQPQAGHDGMTIGLAQYQDERPASLAWILTVPFRSEKRQRSIGSRTRSRLDGR
ncbi:MAG: sterol desaturase family protein [Pseudomonadota bacterium]